MKKRKKKRRPTAADEGTYICPTCGEQIVVPIDQSGGIEQQYPKGWRNEMTSPLWEYGRGLPVVQYKCRHFQTNLLSFSAPQACVAKGEVQPADMEWLRISEHID
jgi:hypothetical protein